MIEYNQHVLQYGNQVEAKPPIYQEHIYKPEEVYRFYQTHNILNLPDEAYEYAQPKTYIMGANAVFQVDNPFNTPAQYLIYLLAIPDNGAMVSIQADSTDTISIPANNQAIKGMIGYTFIGPITATANIGQWVDFQQNLQLRFYGTLTTQETVILGFRRMRDLMIPANLHPFNEPGQ